jgi:hypothetical protein
VASQSIAQTPAAYGFPLLIKGLLESAVTRAPEQEIVSANQNRLTYWQFAERVGRLASGFAGLGVERGDTVAIMDWDTHRYGVFLRVANDGRSTAYREHPPFARANSLHDKSHMISLDLRGHGLSDKLSDPAAFQDGKIWAETFGRSSAHYG